MAKTNGIKILAIGNSFSMDAVEYLYPIIKDFTDDPVIIGNLYIAGCSLEKHWQNAESNLAHYEFYKNTDGVWEKNPNVSILDAMLQQDWDIITLQQNSGKSGVAAEYEPYLSNLIDYVLRNATNPDIKLAWHMTWAYQSDSTHHDFVNYNNDQTVMFGAIQDALRSVVLKTDKFSYIIPAGVAIQNARKTFGDTLTRDGFHLSIPLGRYIAGLSWLAALTEFDYTRIQYLPEGISRELLPQIIEAVKISVEMPL
jgi:hypothetical protein